MKLRIRYFNKAQSGYVVQYQAKKWYGLRYWKAFISITRINKEAFFHSTYEHAEKNMLNKIKWACEKQSKK